MNFSNRVHRSWKGQWNLSRSSRWISEDIQQTKNGFVFSNSAKFRDFQQICNFQCFEVCHISRVFPSSGPLNYSQLVRGLMSSRVLLSIIFFVYFSYFGFSNLLRVVRYSRSKCFNQFFGLFFRTFDHVFRFTYVLIFTFDFWCNSLTTSTEWI